MSDENEIWLKDVLVPSLVDSGKLGIIENDETIKSILKNIEIRKLSLTEAFMMNSCYKIQVTLSKSTDDTFSTIIGIVVKVIFILNKFLTNYFIKYQSQN